MKKLVLTFYEKDGEVVPQLSKDPASPNDVISALNFLDEGQEIRIASVTCDKDGNTI